MKTDLSAPTDVDRAITARNLLREAVGVLRAVNNHRLRNEFDALTQRLYWLDNAIELVNSEKES